MLDAYSRALVWCGRKHAELSRRIGIRTGNLFELKKIEKNNQISMYLEFRGYDNADGTPKNPFQNETFKHASGRLTKNKYKKLVLKGGAKSFAKRKKVAEELLSIVIL